MIGEEHKPELAQKGPQGGESGCGLSVTVVGPLRSV